MVSALLMFRRVARAVRYAIREEDFIPVLGAGAVLLLLGTIAYQLGEGWSAIDALYFSVATLTTTSVSDPHLVLDQDWMKLFTIFFQLLGIGVLVEILRRLGVAFVKAGLADRRSR
jgi:hypothetical protein